MLSYWEVWDTHKMVKMDLLAILSALIYTVCLSVAIFYNTWSGSGGRWSKILNTTVKPVLSGHSK